MSKSLSAYDICTREALGEVGKLLTWEFNADELRDDAICRAVMVTALKLCLWRKHPIIRRMRLLIILCSAWCELCALISYERGKLFSDLRGNVIRELTAINSRWS